MSDFAFFRFKSTKMLTKEEEEHKEEIVKLTEEVLDSRGIECDARIAKISEDELRRVLEEVRKLRRKRKQISSKTGTTEEGSIENQGEQYNEEEKETSYVK